MVQQEHHGGLISVLTLRICSFQQTSKHIIQLKTTISSSELKLKQTGLEESSESPWLYMLYNYHIDTKSRYKVTHREDKLHVIAVKRSIMIRNPSSHTVPNPKPPLSAQLVF